MRKAEMGPRSIPGCREESARSEFTYCPHTFPLRARSNQEWQWGVRSEQQKILQTRKTKISIARSLDLRMRGEMGRERDHPARRHHADAVCHELVCPHRTTKIRTISPRAESRAFSVLLLFSCVFPGWFFLPTQSIVLFRMGGPEAQYCHASRSHFHWASDCRLKLHFPFSFAKMGSWERCGIHLACGGGNPK
jgi:hypothetical protein